MRTVGDAQVRDAGGFQFHHCFFGVPGFGKTHCFLFIQNQKVCMRKQALYMQTLHAVFQLAAARVPREKCLFLFGGR